MSGEFEDEYSATIDDDLSGPEVLGEAGGALATDTIAVLSPAEPICLPDAATVQEAVQIMLAQRQAGVLVTDAAGRLVGIFTERDVLTRIVAAGRNPDTTLVGEVMSTELVVAELNESYEVCLGRMRQAHVRHVLALQDGRLAGIVSLRDVMAADVDEKAEELTLLNAYVHYIPANITPRP